MNNSFKSVLFFICLSLIISSCAKKKEVDTMALLKEELRISIKETQSANFEIVLELKLRAVERGYKSELINETAESPLDSLIDLKRNSFQNAKSNKDLLKACRADQHYVGHSEYFNSLPNDLRFEDLSLNKLYKLQELEKRYNKVLLEYQSVVYCGIITMEDIKHQ